MTVLKALLVLFAVLYLLPMGVSGVRYWARSQQS